MGLLLDTSAIIEYMRENPAVVEIIDAEDDISISVISHYETLIGIQNKKAKDKAERFFEKFPLLPIDRQDSDKAIKLYEFLKSEGKTINMADILIAAQCDNRSIRILTKDRDFKELEKMGLRALFVD